MTFAWASLSAAVLHVRLMNLCFTGMRYFKFRRPFNFLATLYLTDAEKLPCLQTQCGAGLFSESCHCCLLLTLCSYFSGTRVHGDQIVQRGHCVGELRRFSSRNKIDCVASRSIHNCPTVTLYAPSV